MIKFGTDGWRAVIGEDFTFENVKNVAQAYVHFLKLKRNKSYKVVVGFDTRFLSHKFARTFSSVLAANKIKTFIFQKPLPSPCLCFAIRKYGFSGGVMITASHNPPEFNGIKIKTEKASPASSQLTQRLERLINKYRVREIDYILALKKGLIKEVDYKNAYLRYLRKYVNFEEIKKKHFRILYDAMYGAGDNLMAEILKNTKNVVETIRGEKNPSFGDINPEPIPRNLRYPLSLMQHKKYDICLITDGDADRIGAIIPGGRFLNPGWIMSLLLLHFIRNRKEKGVVVKTISNSSLIEKITRKYDLLLQETPVGFKNIAEVMEKDDVLIGGEESGGIGFKNYIPERDGLLSGLLLLEMMAYENKTINEIIQGVEKEFGKFYYRRRDIHYPDKLKLKLFQKLKRKSFPEISGVRVVDVKSYDGVKFILKDGSWLLFRLSGTEPILRIYSEATSLKKVKSLLQFGEKFALSLK